MATSRVEPRKARAPARRPSPGGILTLVGRELRKRRKEKQLTQLNLSVEAGLSQNVVGRIERGIYNPTIVVLHAIATRLGIPVTDLLQHTELPDALPGLQRADNFHSR